MNNISKDDAPSLYNSALWADADSEAFYSYNGGNLGTTSYKVQGDPPPNSFWRFTPSGASGSWSEVVADTSPNFSTLTRSVDGYYASGGGLGFALGGYVGAATEAGLPRDFDGYEIPGMVIYNTTSSQWYNVTSPGSNDVAAYGAAHYVPIFGPAGILMTFGGFQGDSAASFDWVLLYEPISQTWHYQRATGDLPPKADAPCVVGIEGDDDTYEACQGPCPIDL